MVSIELDAPKTITVSTSSPVHVGTSSVEVQKDKSSNKSDENKSEKQRPEEPAPSSGSGNKSKPNGALIPEVEIDADSTTGDQIDYKFLANPQHLADTDNASSEVIVDKDKDTQEDGAVKYAPRYDPLAFATHYDASDNRERGRSPDLVAEERSSRYAEKRSTDPITSLLTNLPGRPPNELMSEEQIRRTKSYLLHQFQTKNVNQQYSQKELDMSHSLEEIQDELEYMNHRRQSEISLQWWRRALTFVAESISTLNARFDPFDVDLSDWSRNIFADVHTYKQYDEVLEDLIRKWQTRMPDSPELKLLLIMGGSLSYSVLQQRKERAQLAQMKEDERRMDERIRAQVAEQIAQMNRSSPTPMHPYYPAQQSYAPQQPAPATFRAPGPAAFTGPSLSNDDYLQLMRDKYNEQRTEEEDHSDTASSAESENSTRRSVSPAGKAGGSAPTSPPPSPRPVQRSPAKPARKPKAGTGAPKRRGRPPKTPKNAIQIDI